MSMQFFNFGNSETFHFFKWVSESGQVVSENGQDLQGLIDKAFQEAEGDAFFKMDVDVCYVVKEKLADLLYDVIWEIVPDLDPDVAPGIGEVGIGPGSLWLPILSIALERIDCHTVAEALLIRAGKWAPSKESPEIL